MLHPRQFLSFTALLILLAPLAAGRRLATAETPSPIQYVLKQRGQVSAAVYDERGRLLRTLLRATPHAAGEHRLQWDGLDRGGQPVPAGEYEIRLLRKPPFKAEYITSLGINPGSAPYEKWVGNHGGVFSVAVDTSGVYFAAQITETAPVLLKQSLDGAKRHWTRGRGDVTDGRYQGGAALASDGKGTIYMLQQNGYLEPIDAESGALKINKYNRRRQWDALHEDVRKTIKKREEVRFLYQHDAEKTAGADLAARGNTLVVSYHRQNAVHWLSPVDGSVTHRMTVSAPWGVAVGRDGQVLAISGNRVLDLDPEADTQRVIIDDGLQSPRRLAVDPTTGDLLVAERGDSHQVKRFSRDGKLLAAYGKQGGRDQGIYHPEDFYAITDIEADADGGFFVAEPLAGPRRVAHFDREGRLINQWYGGQPYYAWAEPDPRDPTLVWFNPHPWLTLAKIDYKTGTWRVLENYDLNSMGDGLVHAFPGHAGRWHVVYRDGQRYLISSVGGQILAHEKRALRPVSVAGDHRLEFVRKLTGRGDTAKSYRWVDQNEDGRPQAKEIAFGDGDAQLRRAWVVEDLVAISAGNAAEAQADEQHKVEVRETAPRFINGRPAYPIGGEGVGRPVAATPTASRTGTRGRAAYRSAEGDYYAHYNAGPERHGSSWPTYWGGRSRLVKWNARGEQRWKVGRHAIHGGLGPNPHTTPNGCMHVPAGIIGETTQTIVVADRVENIAMNWTKDGLYAGDFFDDRVDDGLPAVVYHWWRTPEGKEAIITSDNAQGGRVLQTDDGEVLWFVQGRNSVPVYRIHGWKGWTRHSHRVKLKGPAPHARAGGSGLAATYFNGESFEGSPALERIDARIWSGSPRRKPGNDPVVDGFHHGPHYDWSDGVDRLQRQFAVRWRGQIEAPLSEDFTFSVYCRGRVRLWIDGVQRIFGWNECSERWESDSVSLVAGRRYDVQLDFATSQPHPACSLNWESHSFDRRRIAQRYLYPETAAPLQREKDVYPAEKWIAARGFDAQSGDITQNDVRGETVRGSRDSGFAGSGAWLRYSRVGFDEGPQQLVVEASARPAGNAEEPVTLEFRVGSPQGRLVARLQMDDREQSPERGIHDVALKPVRGVHDVYVVNATGKRWHFIRFDRWKVTRQESAAPEGSQ